MGIVSRRRRTVHRIDKRNSDAPERDSNPCLKLPLRPDPIDGSARVKVKVKHHDPDINAIFNDPAKLPEVLIAADRDVRIESW